MVSMLYIALQWQENVGVVRVLPNKGTSLSHYTHEGFMALMIAASKGQLEVMRLLCNARADMSVRRNANGSTSMVLMITTFAGHLEAVLLLCSAGSDVSVCAYALDNGYLWGKF